MRTIVFICLWAMLNAVNASASEFRYLRPYEGLKDSEINSISQDKDGLIWLATWTGLISYDGYSFIQYRPELGNPESLPTKKIKIVFVDSRGNIWVATDKNLSLYDKENGIFLNFKFERDDSSPVNIFHFSELSDKLIIHTVDGFYYIPLVPELGFELIAKKIILQSNSPDEEFYFHYSMSVGDQMYFASNSGSSDSSVIFAGKFSDNEGTGRFILREVTTVNSRVNKIVHVKPENSLYLATENGVKTYSLSTESYIRSPYFEDNDILNIIYTSNNRIYCSTLYPELFYIDLHTGDTGQYISNPNQWGSLLNNNILSLYEDFSGNLWIGHQGQGVSILNLHRKEFHTYRHNPMDERSLISNTIMCISEGPEEIFLGARVGGINVLSKEHLHLENPEYLRVRLREGKVLEEFNAGIWDIQKVTNDYYLAGTTRGLFKLRKSGQQWELSMFSDDPLFTANVRKIYIDKNHNVWVGIVGEGLIFIPDIIDNEQGSYYQYKKVNNDPESLSDNEIISMLVDSEQRFWIGTVHGLNLLKVPYHSLDVSGTAKPKLRFKRYIAEHPDSNYLNNNEINCIFENSDGTIWLATQGGGINILSPEKDSFNYITVDNNLPSNDVFGILKDEAGVLWMSTNNGLTTYNQYSNDPMFITYRYQDGIQGNIFMVNSYYKSWSGEMYFGGDNGFTRFLPKDIKVNPIPPKVYLTNLKVYNEHIEIGDTLTKDFVLEKGLNSTTKIVLPFEVKVFSIGVASLHFQFPEGNTVIYKLEGYDNNWKRMMASNRYIEFSNLPFGKYNLLISAISSDNIQSPDIRILAIEITPPWYREWYFVLLFVSLGLAAVISFIYIAYNRQKLSYQKKLHDMSIEANESKMQFLTNIAHGLRTPLSLVIGPVEDMMQNYSDVSPKWRNHLFLIHRNSNYLLKLINQIIDFRKLHAGKLKLYRKDVDIAELVKEVGLNFKDLEGRQKVNLEFDLPDKPVIISVDPQKIEEVLYNLLSNAFKHTSQNKTIKLTVESLTNLNGVNKVKISVFNEGSYIDEKDRQKIFERFYKTDENKEGAGIGLSFSKSLVELHDGKIEAVSIHDRGTVFHIYLPMVNSLRDAALPDINVKEEAVNYELNEESVSYEESSIEEDDKNLKILLVEDNEDLRGFLKNVLSRGYSCYEAENGEEGLMKVKEIMPDIVVSDIIMPVMDGYELCKAIKDSPGTCHIPVILLTAKDTNEQIKSGYDVGADAYVTKPFDLGVIGAQISRLIKNRELIRKKYIDQNFMIEVNRSGLSKDDEFIINIRNLLESNISDPEYNVKEMAASLKISSTQLYRKIKALTGYSPVEFIRLLKLQKAYELLVDRTKSVKEVCYLSGFNNVSYFIKCFKDQFGITPAGLRDNPVEEEVPDNNNQLSQ